MSEETINHQTIARLRILLSRERQNAEGLAKHIVEMRMDRDRMLLDIERSQATIEALIDREQSAESKARKLQSLRYASRQKGTAL